MKLLTALLLSVTTISYSQDYTPSGLQAEDNLRNLGRQGSTDNVFTFNNRYQGVKGTPFLQKRWESTEIILTKGDTVSTKTKLNLFTKEVWAILSTGDSVIVDQGRIKEFTYFDSAMNQKRRFIFVPDKEMAYYEILFSGQNITLLAKRNKHFERAMISGGYTTGEPYDIYTDDKSTYFIRKNKNKLFRVKQTQPAVEEVFGPQAVDILNKHKLNVENETDLVTLAKEMDGTE